MCVENRLPDRQLVSYVVAQVATLAQHDVEEGSIVAVRCQDELGHLLIGAQFPTRCADLCKLMVRRIVDGHDMDSRPMARFLAFERYGSGSRPAIATTESLVKPTPARLPYS
jgi:hypothetical protein